MQRLFVGLLAVVWGAGAQDMAFQVQLRSPLSTDKNHKGDAVMALVVSPESFQNDLMEGKVTEVKSGNKLHGQSVLNFTFETIQHAGQSVPVSSSITSMANSKGQENVDEEGRVIRKSSNLGKAAAGTGAGALIGGLTHGIKGAAIGAGVGAAASIILIEVAAEGPKVEFAPGSRFGLSVKSRGGPDLSTLGPGPGGTPATANASAAPPSVAPPAAAPAVVSVGPAPAAAAPATPDTGGQPQFSTVRIDFVPGERTVFFDDFSDMAADEPPPHWRIRGNTVELRSAPGVRELYAKEDVAMTSPTFQMPPNFTFELQWTGGGEIRWRFRDKNDNEVMDVTVRGEPSGTDASAAIAVSGPNGGTLGNKQVQANTNQPVLFALWAQQGRVRAYINGERILDVNQVAIGPIDHMTADIANYRPNGIRSIRVAESAPDFSAAIGATGKYISHGIHFDTDSDRLQTDSAAVLKAVAAGLQKNPNLKLEIDGYTDSVGDAKHNHDLSERRAAAVRQVLVAQFGVDASRLTAKGFGPDQPIGSNDTPEGRAENRRVEFVKQ
jgi:OmpA-OmpF porin, OOP family